MTALYKGEPWLTVLNSQDIEILSDTLNAAQSKLRRAHPGEGGMWYELMDLLEDLHVSWQKIWPTEKDAARTEVKQ